MKKLSGPIKNSSPLKCAILPDIKEEEIVLVQTNHSQEEKDLVILEASLSNSYRPLRPISRDPTS